MEKKKRDDDDAIPRPRPSPLSPLSRLSRPRSRVAMCRGNDGSTRPWGEGGHSWVMTRDES